MQTIIDRRGKYTNNIRKYNTFIELFQLFLTEVSQVNKYQLACL